MSDISKIISYRDRVQNCLQYLDLEKVNQLSNLIMDTIESKKVIYLCGNGGSASTANHFAVDLLFNLKLNTNYSVHSLVSNESNLTATGNDIDFSQVFSRQIEIMGEKNDLLLLISASGNSKNLILANEIAIKKGLKTFGILGFDGGQLLNLVQNSILVKTEIGDYGVVEDIHLMINHIIVENIKK